MLLARRARLAEGGHELGDGGQEGPGCDRPAQLLDHDDELDEPEAQAAAGLGHGQSGPAQVDHLGPELVRRHTLLGY